MDNNQNGSNANNNGWTPEHIARINQLASQEFGISLEEAAARTQMLIDGGVPEAIVEAALEEGLEG